MDRFMEKVENIRQDNTKSRLLVTVLGILVSFLITFANLMVQFVTITMQPLVVPAFQLVVVRKVLTAAFALPYVLVFTDILATMHDRKATMPLAVASFFNLLAAIAAVFALQTLTLEELLTIATITPFMCMIASRVILKEPILLSDAAFAAMTGFGVLLAAQPKFIFGAAAEYTVMQRSESDTLYWLGVLFGFMFAATNTLTYVYARLAYRATTPLVFLFVEGVVGSVLSILWMVCWQEAFVVPTNFAAWVYTMNLGASIFSANVCTHLAISFGNAVILTAIRNLDIVFGSAFQYFIFGISLNTLSVCGAVIVIGAVLGQMILRLFRKQE